MSAPIRPYVQLGDQAWAGRKVGGPAPTAAGWRKMHNRSPDHGGWHKPDGGLWTSTWDAGRNSSGRMDWCLGEEFAGPRFETWLLAVDSAARIYQIDCRDDLVRLVDRYPMARAWALPYYSHDRYPSWEAVARDYDAVNLTDRGQWATRLCEPPSLYGWDCESTLWLRWSFASVTPLGTITPEREGAEA